jgi:hypothetical protein
MFCGAGIHSKLVLDWVVNEEQQRLLLEKMAIQTPETYFPVHLLELNYLPLI